LIFCAGYVRFIPMIFWLENHDANRHASAALRWMALAGALGASAAFGGWLAEIGRHRPFTPARAMSKSQPGGAEPLSRRAAIPGPLSAHVTRIIDGDTFEARIAIWFGQEKTVLVRLRGADAPEMRSRCESERQLAQEAQAVLAGFLEHGRVTLTALSVDKYAGRVVADASALQGGRRSPGSRPGPDRRRLCPALSGRQAPKLVLSAVSSLKQKKISI